jgi:hypothetical protein
MNFSSIRNRLKSARPTSRNRGSVLPFLAIGMPVVVAFLACSLDLTRNITAVRQLQFAADSAAVYVASHMTDANGAYDRANAVNEMYAALNDVNGTQSTAWNSAPAGPGTDGKRWRSDVTFAQSDLVVVANPADEQEQLVELTARREGSDALRQFFAPAITAFAALSGQTAVAAANASPKRIAEVAGQPASRVGAAQPWGTSGSVMALAPMAVFPLAISNTQFAPASSNTDVNTTTPFVGEFITPSAPALRSSNHWKVCFVNVGPATASGQTHGAAQASTLDALINEINYFASHSNAAPLPAAMERGNAIFAYNPSDAAFVSREPQIYAAMQKLPVGTWLILPVINADPSFTAGNQVAGFAYAQFNGITPPSQSQPATVRLSLGPTVPLRNVSADGRKTVPTVTGEMLPPPVAPFTPRSYNAADNSLSKRPAGVALAPVLSPRRINPS